MHNSVETMQLERLIARKKEYYNKWVKMDPNAPGLRDLNSEITFLSDTILPLLLMRTTVYYNELSQFVTQSRRKLEAVEEKTGKKANAILLYYELQAPAEKNEIPLIAMDSNRYMYDTGLEFNSRIYGLETDHIIMQNFQGWRQTKLSDPLKFVDPRIDSQH